MRNREKQREITGEMRWEGERETERTGEMRRERERAGGIRRERERKKTYNDRQNPINQLQGVWFPTTYK